MSRQVVFGVVLLGILVLGIGSIKSLSAMVYARSTVPTTDDNQEMMELTKVRAAKENDRANLLKTADALLKKKLPQHARYYYARLSEVDPNLRDAAYAWAYSIAISREGVLTSDDVAEILQAIERVERVDPLYVPMLEIKLAVAQVTQDQPMIEATQKRLELLKD